jgi:integrase/recombinase XerD
VIAVLWRAGLRISEALALAESDLDRTCGAVLVRQGKSGKRREVGMDRWAWEQLEPWLTIRATLPVGAVFCVLRGRTRGRPCSPAGIRAQLRNTAREAGVRRRFAPHQYADICVMPRSLTKPCCEQAQAQELVGITEALEVYQDGVGRL